MAQICSQCGTQNVQTARFCITCGKMLGATQLQGKTLVAASAAVGAAPSPVDMNTVARRVQRACASVQVQALSRISGRRELTNLLVDVSGSMGGPFDAQFSKLQAAIDAAVTNVRQKAALDDQDEVAVSQFSDDAQIVCPMTLLRGNQEQLISSIRCLSIQGGTDINAGLELARDRILDWKRPGVVRRIILLTDGHGGDALATAAELKSRGVVIDCIGVGEDPAGVDEQLLKKIASVIAGEVRYRFIRDRQTLVTHYTVLAGKTATA